MKLSKKEKAQLISILVDEIQDSIEGGAALREATAFFSLDGNKIRFEGINANRTALKEVINYAITRLIDTQSRV